MSDCGLAHHNCRYEDYLQKEEKEEDYDMQKWYNYWAAEERAADVSTSESSTTTTSGTVMPTHLFRHYHNGFDVASWQAHEKAVASDVKDYETGACLLRLQDCLHRLKITISPPQITWTTRPTRSSSSLVATSTWT